MATAISSFGSPAKGSPRDSIQQISHIEGRIIQAPFAAPPHLPLRPGTPLTLIGESLQTRMQLLIAEQRLLAVSMIQIEE